MIRLMLLERSAELAELWQVVEAARAGAGGVAVVEGEAGIGKTSLLELTAARAGECGVRVLRARGTVLEHEYGYGIVRQLFERDADPSLLSGVAGLAAPALGLPAARPAGDDSGFGVRHGLYWLACNLAERDPVLLLVDDAHWSDLPSLRWLAYLAGRLDGVGVAVLISWRTGEPDAPDELLDGLRAESVTRSLVPPPLTEEAGAVMLRDAFGGRADPDFCRACHQVAGGNPFLLGALADELVAAGIAPDADAVRHVRNRGPVAVRRSVRLRLARLSPGAQALARAVSVLDSDAEPRFAYNLAGLDGPSGARAAAELELARLLAVGGELRFTHPILRAAVYEQLPAATRALEHRHAAWVLAGDGGDPDRAAVHLLATHPAGDRWVTDQLRRAAGRAVERGAPETALVLLDRALAEPPPEAERAALLLSAGRTARILTRRGTRRYLAAAYDAATDPVIRSDAAAELARATVLDDPAEGVALLRTALAELPPGESGRADRHRLELLTIESTRSGRDPGAVEGEIEALYDEAAAGSATRLGAACLRLWHQHWWADQPDSADVDGLARELTDVGPMLDTFGADFIPLSWGAWVLAHWGHLETGNAMLVEAMKEARRDGNAFAVTLTGSTRAWFAVMSGDFAGAETDARSAARLAAATGSPVGQRGAVGSLVFALAAQGAYTDADAVLAAHGLSRDAGTSAGIDSGLLVARSLLHAAQGRFAAAGDDALRLIDMMPPAGPLNMSYLWAPRALVVAGRQDRAEDLAERAVTTARRSGLTGVLGIALHTAGLVGQSVDLLAEAVDVLATSPWRWELAGAQVDLGAALRRANRRQEARDPLRDGLELARRIGARGVVERAREELLASGARPRRTAFSGVGALTPSERRVADLAARGATIAEIAQGLFVTRKTVESHLYAAYRKLGVSTREELSAALS